jgi:hypothetical protein
MRAEHNMGRNGRGSANVEFVKGKRDQVFG